MAKKKPRIRKPNFKEPEAPVKAPSFDQKSQKRLTLSFLYFQYSNQCFSSWEKEELKQFSKSMHLICDLTVSQLLNKGFLKYHKGNSPIPKGFSYPQRLEKGKKLSELLIKKSKQLRIHGFLHENTFYVIWLDRKHDFYKGK